MSFNLAIGSALAGLGAQVGTRLGQLGAGQAVRMVVMPEQTRQLVDRAGTDTRGVELAVQAKDALSLLETLKNNCSERDIAAMWTLQHERLEKMRTASPGDRETLEAAYKKTEDVLEAFAGAIDKVKKTPGQETKLTEARAAVDTIDPLGERILPGRSRGDEDLAQPRPCTRRTKTSP